MVTAAPPDRADRVPQILLVRDRVRRFTVGVADRVPLGEHLPELLRGVLRLLHRGVGGLAVHEGVVGHHSVPSGSRHEELNRRRREWLARRLPRGSIEWVDWGDAAAWAALGVALVAAFFSGRSVAEAKKARIAGERSAAAAEDSAREAKRSADAGEVSAQAAVRSADAAEKAHQLAEQQYLDSLPPPVAWEIRQVSKSTYQLINIGAATATGVSIDPDSVRIGRQFP